MLNSLIAVLTAAMAVIFFLLHVTWLGYVCVLVSWVFIYRGYQARRHKQGESQ
jgi:4-hydroxybenzoate polyprenyltransferase